MNIEVTDADRDYARLALDNGYNDCKRSTRDERCDCDLSITNGCKARVEAVARIIAKFREAEYFRVVK